MRESHTQKEGILGRALSKKKKKQKKPKTWSSQPSPPKKDKQQKLVSHFTL